MRGCTREFETYGMQFHECSRNKYVTESIMVTLLAHISAICAPPAAARRAPERGLDTRDTHGTAVYVNASCRVATALSFYVVAIARERVAPQFLRDVDPGAASARMSSCFAAAPQI